MAAQAQPLKWVFVSEGKPGEGSQIVNAELEAALQKRCEATAGGQAYATLSADEWKACGVSENLRTDHFARAGDIGFFRPALGKKVDVKLMEECVKKALRLGADKKVKGVDSFYASASEDLVDLETGLTPTGLIKLISMQVADWGKMVLDNSGQSQEWFHAQQEAERRLQVGRWPPGASHPSHHARATPFAHPCVTLR